MEEMNEWNSSNCRPRQRLEGNHHHHHRNSEDENSLLNGDLADPVIRTSDQSSIQNRGGSECFLSRINLILLSIVIVQLVGIVILIMDKLQTTSLSELEGREHYSQFVFKPRCFSMCESPDIFYRGDKLIKTVVTFDKFSTLKTQPVRHFMFLFPDPPKLSEKDTGKPLFLTDYIQKGDIETARNLSRVGNLDNFDQIESYSGFITINKTYNSNIYFWYFPAQSGNTSAPVILWLQGGPGSSGFFGLLKEHGPYLSDVDPTGLPYTKKNPYTWTKEYSVIYVDNPVGTGFSFTDDPAGYPVYINSSTNDLYNFLQQFYQMFPEQQKNLFYAFGESYGGKYAPALAIKIYNENQKSENVKINLAGIGIGNGWMSPIHQGRYASYLKYHGLLDHIQFKELNRIDEKFIELIKAEEWHDAWKSSDEQLDFILTALNYSNLYDMTQDQYHPSSMNFWFWLEQASVRRAIHVGNRSFSDGLDIYMTMVGDTMLSIMSTLQEVIKNYKVLAYHGALDIICHYPGAELMFSEMDWPENSRFEDSARRSWWAYNEKTRGHELGGYVKKAGNLRLALIRNAGHSVPLNQPEWSLRLIDDFINSRI